MTVMGFGQSYDGARWTPKSNQHIKESELRWSETDTQVKQKVQYRVSVPELNVGKD